MQWKGGWDSGPSLHLPDSQGPFSSQLGASHTPGALASALCDVFTLFSCLGSDRPLKADSTVSYVWLMLSKYVFSYCGKIYIT